ncbi:hypothetical protein ACLBKU_05180 [Erythrobacter sp. NE805]
MTTGTDALTEKERESSVPSGVTAMTFSAIACRPLAELREPSSSP